MTDLLSRINNLVAGASVFIALATAILGVVAAMKAGVLRRIRFGSIELEAQEKDIAAGRELIEQSQREPLPFESEQLAKYYSQVLGQSRISFWFSLIFASLGFAIIVIAAMLYSESRTGATVASFSAGGIIDAVAALFFVQSRDAQKAMAEFFNKLRTDRESLESRNLANMVGSPDAKDALRIFLALHLAGVPDSLKVADAVLKTAFGARGTVPLSPESPATAQASVG